MRILCVGSITYGCLKPAALNSFPPFPTFISKFLATTPTFEGYYEVESLLGVNCL